MNEDGVEVTMAEGNLPKEIDILVLSRWLHENQFTIVHKEKLVQLRAAKAAYRARKHILTEEDYSA